MHSWCTTAQHAADGAAATAVGVAGQNCNGDEGAHEEEVHDNGQEGKEDDAAEEESQDDSEGSVNNRGARNALNRFRIGGNVHIVLCHIGEEVGEDTEA